ncbi:CDP-glycerol glycerophosphotransferase family protein [Virgibacillus doumboii]|uniref:CDP-glycerol glycerophosphotransferase family protein n=1 Tax=Virgibacillus doumboii TaxID=2697503 RepID=UPI0013DEAFE6|nr:CDP-glycerol glycerophosphotransferase family protein [Virgibacillus doumboii]
MGVDNVKNNRIMDISLKNNIFFITLPVKESFLHNTEEYYFTLEERYTNKELLVKTTVLKHLEDFCVFELAISFNELKHTFLESDIWDLYLKIKNDEEMKKHRIDSNYGNIRFSTIVIPDKSKMFYPYTTKKGKLSFRLNNYFLYSKFESVNLSEDSISFSGYFNFPPHYKTDDYNIKELKLIVNDSISNDEIEVPIERFRRNDLSEKYEGNEKLMECGIKGVFAIPPNLNIDKRHNFKFYLEMKYEKDNELMQMRSSRIRMDHHSNNYPIKKIINYQGQKVKLFIKPTSESKYLSFQMSKYSFKNEALKTVKSKWVELRRSDMLLKIYKTIFSSLGKLPAKNNTIMFESFLGKQFSDSPRAIYEYLLEHHPEYKMYWSADRRYMEFFEGKNVNHVRRFSIKWLLLMSRAEYWVCNSRLPLWIPKPKHTTYLQTWHGTPLKRLATDMEEVHMPGTNAAKYKQNFVKATSRWDFLVSPNAYSSEIFKRAFQFNGKMIESGYPRNDFLFINNNKETIEGIKKRCNLPIDKKVILYAPTWRDNQYYAKGKYRFSLQMELDQMKEELGDEYVILLRLHYLVAEKLDLQDYQDFVYDFSFHEDIRELYLISDILITDYSSVFFDYANLKRPMIFFVYDIDDYRDNLRGFYFNFEAKAPGPLVKSTDEIIRVVKNIEKDGFQPTNTTEAFYERFCYLEDGHASERVVKGVFND